MGSTSLSLIVAVTIILAIIRGIHGLRFDLINEVEKTDAGAYFDSLIDGKKDGLKLMKKAANYIWDAFEQWSPYDHKPLKKVTLYIDGEENRASTYAIVDTENGEIRISAKHLRDLNVDEGEARQEFKELLYYEMTHIFQWIPPNGDIPEALKDGVAAFIVLRVRYEPQSWATRGVGESWDEKYDITARFLEYCSSYSINFVAQLNRKLRYSYSENLFPELLGETRTIAKLWGSYKKKYGKRVQKNTKL